MNGTTNSSGTDGSRYEAWVRARVQEAIDDPRPAIDNEEVTRNFAARRAAAMEKG